jgi:hypothetical protein
MLKKLLTKISSGCGDLTWSHLAALDPSLTEKIFQKALEYGYEHTTTEAGISR